MDGRLSQESPTDPISTSLRMVVDMWSCAGTETVSRSRNDKPCTKSLTTSRKLFEFDENEVFMLKLGPECDAPNSFGWHEVNLIFNAQLNDNTCSMCLDNPSGVRMMPCNHCVVCGDCYHEFPTCDHLL